MKRTVGALAALALLSSTAAWAASAHRAPVLQAPAARGLPNVDLSLETATRMGPAGDAELPRFIWNTRDQQTRARAYGSLPAPLAANAQLSGLARGLGLDEVRTMGLSYASITTNQLGQRIVNYEQRVGGIEVFRGGASVLLDRSQQAVAYSSRLVPQAFGLRDFDVRAFELSASEAISIGYTDMTGEAITSELFVAAPGQGEYVRFTTSPILNAQQSFLATPARAKRVLFPTRHGLVPAWYVEVQAQRPDSRSSEGYAYVISAAGRKGKLERGTLLMRHNLVADADLVIRAWADTAHPFTPHDGPEGPGATPYPYPAFDQNAPYNAFVPSNLVTLPDARTSAARDPWLPEDATETVGNHAFAYADHVAPDYYSAGDVVGSMNLPFGFDYTFDPSQGPQATPDQIQAAIAQLFYTNNWLHDFFYPAGFDEASGNAQADNFGRGGLDGDPVHAQGQDHSGTDNANMLTPADGTSPRMQMYLFNKVGPWVAEIVDPPDFGPLTANVSTVGPQEYDLTLDMVMGQPNASCGFNNAAEMPGHAVVITWGFGSCTVLDLMNATEAAGAAMTVIDWSDPADPDYAPLVTGAEDLSGIPVTVLSTNAAIAVEAALQDGPVTLHVLREPSVKLDGTIDSAIIAHEWGHYLTNRLIGNGSGLGTNQARSMGEGWSDFVSLLMTTRPEDAAHPNNVDWSGAFPMSTYATRGFLDEWAGYFGIRRLPYSVDRSKNPLTFRHIDDSQPLPFDEAPMLDMGVNSSFHNSGEVWATTLWEGYVALLRAHPFEEAQTRMKNYLVAGLKLTPVQPTFTEARDALLAAIYANDAADFERFAAAFASRGMGVFAVAPARSSSNHAGTVESFSNSGLPQVVEATLTDDGSGRDCDRDGILDNGEDGTLTLRIANVGWSALEAGAVTVTSSTAGVTVSSDAVVVPAIDVYGETTVAVPVSLDGATASPVTLSFEVQVTSPGADGVPPSTVTLAANYDVVTSTVERVNAPADQMAWTHDRDSGLAAISFEIVEMGPERAFYGFNTGSRSDYSLVSPVLQVGQDPLTLSFRHFHEFEHYSAGDASEYYDGGVIELSADGGPWTDIGDAIVSGPGYGGVIADFYDNPLGGREGFVGRHAGFPLFQTTTLDLGTAYAGKDVRIRFRIATDSGFTAEGWYIDDISVNGITNAPFVEFVENAGVCENRPPESHAGDDFSVNEGEVGELQGSATDPDGSEGLTYAWTQVDGPAVTLDTPNAATTTFTAPAVSADTNATFKLTVSDGEFSAEDTVVVTIVNVNHAPIADAGAAQTVRPGAGVTLTGSGVDPDGDVLTFAWTQVSGETVTLEGAGTSTATFTAPEVTDNVELVFALVVSDGVLASEPSQVTVTVAGANEAPVATLVGDESRTGAEGTQLTVAVEATDDDGDEVSITWSQVSGPAAILENADTHEVTVTLPSIEQASAELVLQAIPNDGLVDGAPVTVTIVVTDTDGEGQDGAPVVSVANPAPTREGATVRLVAEGSDPQGGDLSYVWEQIGGPEAELTPEGNVLWVQTPDVEAPTALEFKVTATSSVSGLSASATATVNVVVHQTGGCGGCSSAGAGTLVPAGLAFLAFALRRRRLKV